MVKLFQTMAAAAALSMASILGSQPTRHPLLKLPLSQDNLPNPSPSSATPSLMQHSVLKPSGAKSISAMAQITDATDLDDPVPTTTKMTRTESCMTSLMSSPQRKQQDENTTQGKPKTPRHPSRLRSVQLRQLLSLLALLEAHLSIVIRQVLRINSSRPSCSTGSSKYPFLSHQRITYLPCYLDVCFPPPFLA